jgi:hypothetical protein
MTPAQVIAYFGGPDRSVAATAKALGKTPQIIYYWQDQGRIPYSTQCVIMVKTGGLLIARKLSR